VRDGQAVRDLVATTVADHGRLDVMVNNAGVLFSGPFEETTDAHWDRALDVNVRGVIDGARAAYDQMLTQPQGGWILNTASLAGLMPAPWMTPYTTSKWAIVGFSRALRAEAAGLGRARSRW
jgi:NAD(P)-dependent dehydrogenase (short-subunit alcohol dehydrogenase family)